MVMICSMKLFSSVLDVIREAVPDVYITSNYEDVKSRVAAGDVDRLCIIIGGYNNSRVPWNTIRGYEAARELHDMDPTLPVLVINGWESSVSSVTGLLEKVSRDTFNEVHIDCNDFREDYDSGKLFSDFFHHGIMPGKG